MKGSTILFVIVSVFVTNKCFGEDSCTLKLTKKLPNRPILFNASNDKRIHVPAFVNQITNSKTMRAVCLSNFRLAREEYSYYSAKDTERTKFNEITLLCNGKNWIIQDCKECLELYASRELECNDLDLEFIVHNTNNIALQLNAALDFCEGEQMHIIHYTLLTVNKNRLLGSLCYDTRASTLLSVQYRPSKLSNYEEMLQLPIVEDKMTMSVSGNDYLTDRHFNKSLLQQEINSNLANSPWSDNVHYELHPIVQNSDLDYLIERNRLWFDIIWWHNLRAINWRHFQVAVRERQNNSLTMGVMGKALYPIDLEEETKLRPFIINNGRYDTYIPAYIWAYLTLPGNDVIVFGFNSPFYKFFNSEEVIFCRDICEKIDWMRHFSPLFKDHSAGLIFCCYVDEIPEEYVQQLSISLANNDEPETMGSITDLNDDDLEDHKG